MKTLEDLKNYLNEKHANEWSELDLKILFKAIDEELAKYDLSDEQKEYASPIKALLEDQSNKKTLINAEKAKQVLLKLKEKSK